MQQLKNWLLSHFHAGGGWSYLLCPSSSACLGLCFPWISERVLFPSCLRWLPCQSYSSPLQFSGTFSSQQAKESRGHARLVHPCSMAANPACLLSSSKVRYRTQSVFLVLAYTIHIDFILHNTLRLSWWYVYIEDISTQHLLVVYIRSTHYTK